MIFFKVMLIILSFWGIFCLGMLLSITLYHKNKIFRDFVNSWADNTMDK